MLTQQHIKEKFDYSPETGLFRRKFSCPHGPIGSVAGRKNKARGHVQIKINGKMHYAHRLAWLYMTGSWPSGEVDHKNRVSDDNRWKNLREATKSQNLQNQGRGHAGSSSKLLGVYRHKVNDRWCAQITIDGKQKYLGSFKTEDEAYAQYLSTKKALHPYGEIACA